jgi:two-component system, LytTR family, sensor histidine kinase AlgZ
MTNNLKRPSYLPNFCSLDALFPIVVIGELLAFVLVLRPGSGMVEPWRDLALVSLFIQWVGLTSAGTLCVLGRRLDLLSPPFPALGAWLSVVIVVAALSELTFWAFDLGWVERRHRDTTLLSDTVFWLTRQPLVTLDLDAARHLDFLIRTTTIGAIVGAVALRYVHVQYQWQRNVESEARSRIAALQARIRPHFLFNSMNTIVSFIRSQPDVAEQVVEDLSDLFRASLATEDSHATLASELEIARGYLRIEALRLGDRLRLEWDVDGLPGDAILPRLTLQPLVENAVYHGIERLKSGGTISVVGQGVDGMLSLRVTNPIPANAEPLPGHQIAQANVRERLVHHFGASAKFDVRTHAESYEVLVVVPFERAEARA